MTTVLLIIKTLIVRVYGGSSSMQWYRARQEISFFAVFLISIRSIILSGWYRWYSAMLACGCLPAAVPAVPGHASLGTTIIVMETR